jgi:transposase/predicted phosphodiesterase
VNQTQSKLDNPSIIEAVKTAVLRGDTNATIAHTYGVSEASVRRFRRRHELNPAQFGGDYVTVEGDKAEISTAPTTDGILTNPDVMLRQRGLDPLEWEITALRANEYEGPNSSERAALTGEAKIKYYQTRFTVEKRKPDAERIMAPRTDGWVAPPKTRKLRSSVSPELIVVVGDQQAPFHDETLHALFCEWLEENKPDRGVSLGDSYDFPDIRPGHRYNPENNAIVNECLQAGYDMFRGYVNSSPDTRWIKMIGNLDPRGAYDLAQVNLSDKLAVRHGWIARQGSGVSALATLQHLGYSVIVGHTHRQSKVNETKHEIDLQIRQLTAVEAGCMCRVQQVPDAYGRVFPSYTPSPDWQQGFCTVEMWPDGLFNIDLATYVNGSLMWRGQRYTL